MPGLLCESLPQVPAYKHMRRLQRHGLAAMTLNPYQPPDFNDPAPEIQPSPDPQSLRSAVFFSLLAVQAPCALLALLVLDGGRTARICAVAIFAFWAFVACMLTARRGPIQPRHILFIRWGFLLVMALILGLTSFL